MWILLREPQVVVSGYYSTFFQGLIALLVRFCPITLGRQFMAEDSCVTDS
jgi:hypothetical protein